MHNLRIAMKEVAMWMKRLRLLMLILGGGLFWAQPAGSVITPGLTSQNSSGIAGYVPGVLIVNFKEQLNLSKAALAPSPAQIVQTGVASLDALNVKYRVTKIEKLFPGEKPPTDPRYADLSRYFILEFPSEVSLDEITAEYAKDPNVITAEKDPITTIDVSTPNDPIYLANDQWPVEYVLDHDMDLTSAWDYERGDSAVLLGIIDTGILRTHIDLGGTSGQNYTNGNVWINWKEYNGAATVDDDTNGYVDDTWGWDFVSVGGVWPGEDGSIPDNDPKDFNGHGTHVAGIAAAMTNNSLGIAGVAGGWYSGQRGCKVMALRIGYSAPDPNNPSIERGYVMSSKVGPAIDYARQKGVTAINMSFGIAALQSTIDAVTNALLDGIIMVHSAGNDDTDTLFSVIDNMTVNGTTNQVITVASTDRGGNRSSFSNYGSQVDVSAPGGQVTSTYSDHYTQTYAELSGTSMSSPHVVGLAGLMKSAFPNATGEQIREWILSTTDSIDYLNPGYEGLLGSGLINANNFLSQVPIARFGVTPPTRGHVPFTVNFTDSSLGPVDSLFWDFGDGGTSTDTNPAHIYTGPGKFSVKQYAWSDSFGALYPVSSMAHKDNLIFVIADSIYSGVGHGGVGEKKIPVPIYYRNVYPVTDLTIPMKFGGPANARCDSVNFNGSRISGFLIKSASIDNINHTVEVEASGLSALTPGAGLLATAYFTYDSSSTVGDTSVLDTAIVGGDSLIVVSTDPQAGNYDPKFIQSFLAVEPWPRGDVNKNGHIDLADVIMLVNVIFKGAPAPDPYWLGDFSANGLIELVDVIQMVNRIFK